MIQIDKRYFEEEREWIDAGEKMDLIERVELRREDATRGEDLKLPDKLPQCG